MSFGLYIAGFVIVIGGLIYAAVITHMPTHWMIPALVPRLALTLAFPALLRERCRRGRNKRAEARKKHHEAELKTRQSHEIISGKLKSLGAG